MVVSAYPELELVRTLGAATHGEDVAHTIVTQGFRNVATGRRNSSWRSPFLSKKET